MKRGATDHPKMYELARLMNIPHALAVGYMELLWHFTAKYAPQGDIGRHSNERIAKACRYQGKPARLLEAMVAAGWLEACPRCGVGSAEAGPRLGVGSCEVCQDLRLGVHDWGDHADQGVQRALKAKGLEFLLLGSKKTSSSANQKLSHLSLAKPEPVPEPMPSPVLTPDDVGYWVEVLQEVHPKPCSSQQLTDWVNEQDNRLSGKGRDAFLNFMTKVHVSLEAYAEYWNATGTQYAPKLMDWIDDESWKKSPPKPKPFLDGPMYDQTIPTDGGLR